MTMTTAERNLLPQMPLHAITVVHGEPGLRERLSIETAGWAGRRPRPRPGRAGPGRPAARPRQAPARTLRQPPAPRRHPDHRPLPGHRPRPGLRRPPAQRRPGPPRRPRPRRDPARRACRARRTVRPASRRPGRRRHQPRARTGPRPSRAVPRARHRQPASQPGRPRDQGIRPDLQRRRPDPHHRPPDREARPQVRPAAPRRPRPHPPPRHAPGPRRQGRHHRSARPRGDDVDLARLLVLHSPARSASVTLRAPGGPTAVVVWVVVGCCPFGRAMRGRPGGWCLPVATRPRCGGKAVAPTSCRRGIRPADADRRYALRQVAKHRALGTHSPLLTRTDAYCSTGG